MEKTLVFFILVSISWISCDRFNPKKEILTNCKPGSEPIRKVLFIGWDGVRSDALQNASTPNLDSLIQSGISSYNCDRGEHTVSVPGWSTILHGVWPSKHNLTKNSFRKNKYEQFPDIITIAKQFKPNLSATILSNWDDFLRITSNEDYAQRYDNDQEVSEAAINLLNDCTPDLMILHLDYPDYIGHRMGFSSSGIEYKGSIEVSDYYLGKVMEIIYSRELEYNEEWMVVVTTDHGGEGKGHGGQDDLNQTRYVWAVIRTPNSAAIQLNQMNSVDLLPTMLKWLNIIGAPNLDGQSLN